MMSDIESFVSYPKDVKRIPRNTEISYQGDLMQLTSFLEDEGITEVGKVTKTSLNSYILLLEKEGKITTTVSRELASIGAFFNFMFKEGRIHEDPAELLKAPKIKKKASVIPSVGEISALLDQPGIITPREIRDKAVLELLHATGIRTPELIGLELSDLNMQVGYTACRDGQKERMVPFGKPARQILSVYPEKGYHELLKGRESQWLFTNYSGKVMSYQGFWKIIKYYGEKAGVQTDITPHTPRHSLATHLIRGGADIRAVQAMLGHSDLTTTYMYAAYPGNTVGETYRAALSGKQGGCGNHVLMSPNESCLFGRAFLLQPRAAVIRQEVRAAVCGCCQDGATGELTGTVAHILPGVSSGIKAGEWRGHRHNPESSGGRNR